MPSRSASIQHLHCLFRPPFFTPFYYPLFPCNSQRCCGRSSRFQDVCTPDTPASSPSPTTTSTYPPSGDRSDTPARSSWSSSNRSDSATSTSCFEGEEEGQEESGRPKGHCNTERYKVGSASVSSITPREALGSSSLGWCSRDTRKRQTAQDPYCR